MWRNCPRDLLLFFVFHLTLEFSRQPLSLNASRSSCYLPAERKSSSVVCHITQDSVKITSNDQPAQIMILYLSLENHCARLNCAADLKYDTKFCLLKDSTLVIIMWMELHTGDFRMRIQLLL